MQNSCWMPAWFLQLQSSGIGMILIRNCTNYFAKKNYCETLDLGDTISNDFVHISKI